MITQQDIDDLKSKTKWKVPLEDLAKAVEFLTTEGSVYRLPPPWSNPRVLQLPADSA
jgi:hypothetical protein